MIDSHPWFHLAGWSVEPVPGPNGNQRIKKPRLSNPVTDVGIIYPMNIAPWHLALHTKGNGFGDLKVGFNSKGYHGIS